MAKQRYVSTNFWIDEYIYSLSPIEKLLFLYFITNQYSELCGVYQLPMRYIVIETAVEETSILKSLEKFTRDGKIFYEKGWVAVKNVIKHQKVNPNVQLGIERGLALAPKGLVAKIQSKKQPKKQKPFKAFEDIPHLDLDSDSNLDLDSDSNLDLDIVAEPVVPATFDLKREIEILENHKRRDMQIIGLYLSRKKVDIRTKEQLSSVIKRHLKAAGALKAFDDEQILKGFRKASEFSEWTIETALKHLTK